MCVCVYVPEILLVLVARRVAAANDSAHLNKEKVVHSGVSLRDSRAKCLPPCSSSTTPPQREGSHRLASGPRDWYYCPGSAWRHSIASLKPGRQAFSNLLA